MTRLFLAAGVAALALAMPAAAKPGQGHGGGGGGGGHAAAAPHGGGGGGGGGPHFQAAPRGGGGHFQARSFAGGGRHGGGFSAPRIQQRAQRFPTPRAQRGQRFAGMQRQRVQRSNVHAFAQRQAHGNRALRASNTRQLRMAGARQGHAFARQQMRADRVRAQRQALARNSLAPNRRTQQALAAQTSARNLAARGAFTRNDAQVARTQQQAYQRQLSGTNFAALNYGGTTRFLDPAIANRFVGARVSDVSGYAAVGPLPASIGYLYPPTPDYYYQYGDGYVYQVDRTSNLIAALIPLLAGGYLPGQYLPPPYMASYVPDYYGLNAFYPDYGGICNRYANGVVYQVDCGSGMVEDVVPLYASGYGVGQYLPPSYGYYNVPYQYRRVYYDTPDYHYWYAPGAIYQYDPRSSVITSVAALLSPGFAVGRPVPVGYDVYNVPLAYRSTYYDTPSAWYRYNNGYIYQIDPATQLVTAVVASLLT